MNSKTIDENSTVKLILPKNTPQTLKGPLAGDKPLYIYLSPEKKFILFSDNLKNLLNNPKIKLPLEVSEIGISFLLQSGFIPTPYTVFKNLFVLNIGDEAKISSKNEKITIDFSHNYPFFHSYREKDLIPDEKKIFGLLQNAVLKNLNPQYPIYLFQSIGKDSNTIALALSQTDLKEFITCLTLKTHKKDESELASFFAKKMGLKHRILKLPEKITNSHIEILIHYFENIILPCIDGVSLAYPFYSLEINFKNANIIDGSGNDIYMGHIPRKVEYFRQKIYPHFNFLRLIADNLPTGNRLQTISITKCEMAGKCYGLSFKDAKKIYPMAVPIFSYWKMEDKKRKNWDYFDIKGDIWGPNAEYDLVMKKVRNFAEVFDCNLIFPWCEEEVSLYFAKLPEKYLFDRKTFKNKIILRELLKKYLDLDPDKIGKYSYPFDAFDFLMKMESYIKEELFTCKLWEKKNLEKLYKAFLDKIYKNVYGVRRFKSLIIRLFLISAWFNHNRFVSR